MVVEFQGDAIVLSGETGTKLKCEILEGYYPTWWRITSGGDAKNHSLATAIVELNAGTGLDYIKDTDETILGSSGHALKLKMETPGSTLLKVILVEEDPTCYSHLKNVISSYWPQVDLIQAEGPVGMNSNGVYLLNKGLSQALEAIEPLRLGNSLFFFDPLLFTPWSEIEKVARRRVLSYYQTHTEFIVFLFTSDWFRGRSALNLMPLPATTEGTAWTSAERESVARMDALFGGTNWRNQILSDGSLGDRVERLVSEYRKRLHRWFRYVRPMPFRPKEGQTYHLFMCTNYERGIGITSSFYNKYTNNRSPKRVLDDAYAKFSNLHPDALEEVEGRQKPAVWRFLVEITRDHDEGLCDDRCTDLGQIAPDPFERKECLKWLKDKGYLDIIPPMTDAWQNPPELYKLNWKSVTMQLGLTPPAPLRPLEPKTAQSTLKKEE